MKRTLLNIIIILVSGITQKINSQTFFRDDFSGELNSLVWKSQMGHTHTIENEELKITVEKKDQEEYFRIEFLAAPIDISSNPVVNMKIKADQPMILKFYAFAGSFVIKEVYVPESDVLVPISIDFLGAPSNFDLKALKYINVYVNKDAVSFEGIITLDDFVAGEGAVMHANLGGMKSPVFYSGKSSQKLLVKDIENAQAISVSGVDSYFENLSISPVFQSAFSNYAYIEFDVRGGVSGTGVMNIVAEGAGLYADNQISVPFTVLVNSAPEIDLQGNFEAEVGKKNYIRLSGVSDGDDNLDQHLNITVTSSNQSVIENTGIKVYYTQGSPYADLYFTAISAGSTEITLMLDDQQLENNETSISFQVSAWEHLNIAPTIDPVSVQIPYFDGSESTVLLTGISDGNGNTQELSFTLISSDQTVINDESLNVSDYDPVSGTALLHFTPLSEGSVVITVRLTDDANGTDNGIREVSTDITVKPVTLYSRGMDWDESKNVSRWGGDSGITLKSSIFNSEEVLEVNCVSKWIWGALNFSFADVSLNLTEHPYVSLDVYSVGVRTLHWLWFYDDYELMYGEAHRNDFPNVTNDEGKAVWAEADQWTTITFDFSGENEMARSVGDSPEPINSKRIVRILYNYHDQETTWPRPPDYSGKFYIRNFRIGNKAEMPDPLAAISPVPDDISFAGSGQRTIKVSGLSDGRGGVPQVSIESLDPSYIEPSISSVNDDGTAEIIYDAGSSVGEARIVLTVSGSDVVAVTDTFLIKTLAKDPLSSSGITIDLSQRYQTWQGFGTYMNEYFELYTQEMGASAMRVGIISNQIEPENDNHDPYVLNRGNLNYSAFNWDAMRKMKELGVETFILTSWSAPGWMKDNLSESWFRGAVVPWEQAVNRTSPFYYEEWAEYFVAAYRMFEEEAGIRLAGIGIQNEPAFYEPYPSAILSPAEFAKVIAVVGKRFKQEGIDCKLFMPEQVFSQSAYSMFDYMTAVRANPDANKYTDIIAVHGYASDGIGSGTPNFAAWTSMYNEARKGNNPKDLWMTETHRAYRNYDDAFWIAMAIYGGLEYGHISLWTQWAIVGQHIEDGQPTQMLYTVANFARYIKPGAVRVKSLSSHSDLFATSWLDEKMGKLITVVINNSQTPVSTYLTGDGVPAGYEMYLTNSIRSCEYMGETDDSLFVVPARSVLTLVSSGNKAPTIDPVEDIYLEMNASQQNLLLTGIDPSDEMQSIASITAISSNTELINNLVIGSLQPGGTTNLAFQPQTGKSGVATITIKVEDDGPSFVSNFKTIEFNVMVYDGMNNPPVIEKISDQYLMEDAAGVQSVSVVMNDGDDGTQTLTGSVETDNNGLISDLAFNASSQAVEFTVTPDYYGQANIKLTITDNGGTASNNGNQSAVTEFMVLVASVNDAPVVDQLEKISIPWNAPEQTVTITGIGKGDLFGSPQKISVTAEVNDQELLTSPVIQYFGGTEAKLKFTPVPGKSGSTVITVYVIDDGGILNGGVDFTDMSFEVEVFETVGIDEHEATIHVYPNPANDQLYITNGSMIESITLSNLLGEVILKTNSNVDKIQMNISGLDAGFYLLSIKTNDGTVISRSFIKN